MTQHGAQECAGAMSSPRARNDVRNAVALGLPWCLDNDCYTHYDPPSILRMLKKYVGVPGCVFAALPDVVGDPEGTALLFQAWLGVYQRHDYPIAYVLQDGVRQVPWDSIDAVFIGGSDDFKYSDTVRSLVTKAKAKNKWAHMGRVNTLSRIKYASSIGCDSTDGTGFLRFSEKFRFAPAFKHTQQSL